MLNLQNLSSFLNFKSYLQYYQYLKSTLLWIYWFEQHINFVLIFLVFGLYYLYYRKYRNYTLVYGKQQDDQKIKRGSCFPAYPNGWYRICNSVDLKKGQTKFFKVNGRHIVVFRGNDNEVYCMDAYCPHMGANLSFGKVKYDNCIQCPFHGWIFEGKTGKLIQDKSRQPKRVIEYQYNNGHEDPKLNKDNEILNKCSEGEYTQKTYIIKEHNNIIIGWFHSVEGTKPLWVPMKVQSNHELRGEATIFVNCHIQDITENDTDGQHFRLVHSHVFEGIEFIRFGYQMKQIFAEDKNLKEFLKHKNTHINGLITNILDTHINESQKKHYNISSYDISVRIFNMVRFFTGHALFIQNGISQMFVFINLPFFPSMMLQLNIVPINKHQCKISAQVYTPWIIPYFISAYVVKELVKQIKEDKTTIMDYKIFGEKVFYAVNNYGDEILRKWRNWVGQYYEGCGEFEKSMEKFEW